MPSADNITITNLSDGEVLTYSLAIIHGTVKASTEVYVSSSDTTVPSLACRVVSGAFTALYELQPGHNEVHLSVRSDKLQSDSAKVLRLFYAAPSHARPFVRPVYLLAADSDGSFQSPDVDRDHAAGIARLRTAALMVQAATAELLHAAGLGRRTFALCEVQTHRLPQSLSDTLSQEGGALWSRTVDSLAAQPRREDSVDLAVMSFSQMCDGVVQGHTALGGGPLALFGGASLWTWPESVAHIGARLRDSRRFDARALFDDSAGRAATGGRRMCAATTLGALLHELGHCMSLPHPVAGAMARGGGIMARGFDHFDRIFVRPDAGKPPPFWDRGSAVRLRYHRFFQFEGEVEVRRRCALRRAARQARPAGAVMRAAAALPLPNPGATSVAATGRRVGADGSPVFSKCVDGSIMCESSVGIGHIGYYKKGDNAAHEEFLGNERHDFTLPPLSELLEKCKASLGDELRISAIDVEGCITEVGFDELR